MTIMSIIEIISETNISDKDLKFMFNVFKNTQQHSQQLSESAF